MKPEQLAMKEAIKTGDIPAIAAALYLLSCAADPNFLVDNDAESMFDGVIFDGVSITSILTSLSRRWMAKTMLIG